MDFEFRIGQVEDTPTITDMVMGAGAGIFEFLLNGIVPGVKARDLVRMAIADEKSNLNYGNAVLAEVEGRTVGLVLCYPSDDFGIPPIVETVVPRKRLEHLGGVLTTKVPGTWYINSLYVNEEARGRGLSRLLLEFASDLAVEDGFSELSLHAWIDNKPAMEAYRRTGFTEVLRIPVAPANYLQHQGGMVLLKAPVLTAAGDGSPQRASAGA